MMLWIFLIILGVYFSFKKYFQVLWGRGTGELPPGPWPLPVIGNGLDLDSDKPFKSVEKIAEKYGKIFSLMLGDQLAVFIADLPLVRKAFKDDRFSGRPRTLWHILGFADGKSGLDI
jgi:hypothetical protein